MAAEIFGELQTSSLIEISLLFQFFSKVTVKYETRVKAGLRAKAMGGLKNGLSPKCLWYSGYTATLATVTVKYETRVKAGLRAKAMGGLE